LLLSGQARDYAHQFSQAHFPKSATPKMLVQSLYLAAKGRPARPSSTRKGDFSRLASAATGTMSVCSAESGVETGAG